MTNFKKCVYAALVILLASCNKNSMQAADNLSVSSLTAAGQQAIQAGTLTGIKQSYALLQAAEKQQLWDMKWNAILKNDAGVLNAGQKKIVMQIQQFVDARTIASLMKDPTPGEAFIKNNLSYFQKYFSTEQLYLLIECPYYCDGFSLLKATDYLGKLDERLQNTFAAANAASNNCSCYYSLYCSIGGGGGGTCVTGGCTKNANCGLTGTSNCTGLCK